MSKIQPTILKNAIDGIYARAEEKKRNFVETIELQVALKNYDATRDKRIAGSIKLPMAPKSKNKVCVFGDARLIQEAVEAGIDCMSEDDLAKLNRNKKLVKKLASKYDAFLCTPSLLKKIPRLLGPGLSKAGKFPQVVPPNANLTERAGDACSTIKFQLKIKAGAPMCMAAAVGHVGMTKEELETNLNTAIMFMVGLLKKKWQNVKRLYIKSTMGPSFKIYGI